MTLADLIKRCEWTGVRDALLEAYPDAADTLGEHERVFHRLGRLSPEPNPMRIYITEVFREGLDEAPFTDVCGRNGTLNRERDDFKDLHDDESSAYARAQTEFALEFEPWPRWLGMDIEAVTLAHYTHPRIIAHCLWEMTFKGFDEADIEEARQELDRRAAEVMEGVVRNGEETGPQ